MNPSEIAEHLSALDKLADVPPGELEWLARHGTLDAGEAGTVIAAAGERIEHLWIIFSGGIAVYRDTPAGRRQVMAWGPGDVTGRLPYSRMTAPTADTRLDQDTRSLMLHESLFPEMVARCPVFTEHTVHLMMDRVRQFKATELQAEKLVSLGRLSAGLAHELNNPASATARGAALLREGLAETETAARALFSAELPEEGLAALERARAATLSAPGEGVLSALQQADREAEIEDWLDDHGCEIDHAVPLAETAVTLEGLDDLADALPEAALPVALRWLAASCATHGVAGDIERAAKRIHDLVAAVKRFTYMDNLTTSQKVDVAQGLRDTVTVLAPKARSKDAAIELEIPEDLPGVRGSGSELNQVWMNLMDNALDALPDGSDGDGVGDGGLLRVEAAAEGDRVTVRIIDNGSGIPGGVLDRIFDPFFTTKAQGHGTGLGLDIVQRILTQNDGEIHVESRPGRTQFRIRLPRFDEGAA